MGSTKKKYLKAKKGSLLNLGVVLFSLVAAVFLVQRREATYSLQSQAKQPKCQAVPAGSYEASVSGKAEIPWKIECGTAFKKKGSLSFDGVVPLGIQSLPEIKKGDDFRASKSLSELCGPVGIFTDNSLCGYCGGILNCDKTEVSLELKASKLECSLPTYILTEEGRGEIVGAGSYQGGTCGLTGKGKGSFSVTLKKQGDVCEQVITFAHLPGSSQCQQFPTPCDVPAGWILGCPTSPSPTPISCPSKPPCINGHLIIGDPGPTPGKCPLYSCVPETTPSPPPKP